MLNNVKLFVKKEIVFVISALCAIVTMFLVPPSLEYVEYIDFRVLCLLLCLMAVVSGFRSVGAFRWLTYQLLSRIKNGRVLGATLVMLPFFSSMLVTNDVALLVFIPFTLSLLVELGCEKSIIPVIILQTVGANLGSMATPIGNPQNLFLYSAYNLSASDFFSVVLPLTGLSFVTLTFSAYFCLPKILQPKEQEKVTVDNIRSLFMYGAMFVLCLLTVFRVIPYIYTTVIIVAAVSIIDRKQLKEIDYMLLLTFVSFFIVSENLGRIDIVKDFLQSFLNKSTLYTSVGASQVISNVPAAVLLSGFTDNWKALLQGVNIGGLGTPIASLASLITLKLYMVRKDAKIIRFLGYFTAVNIIGLAILLAFICIT